MPGAKALSALGLASRDGSIWPAAAALEAPQ